MNLKTNYFKKLVSLFLCFVFVFGNSIISFAQDTKGVLGDIDGNNVVNAEDAAIVLASVLGDNKIQLTEEEKQRARVTGNKIITVNDAARILQKVLDNKVQFIPFVDDSSDTTLSETSTTSSVSDTTTETDTATETDTVTETETETETETKTETDTETETDTVTETETTTTTEVETEPVTIAYLNADYIEEAVNETFTQDKVIENIDGVIGKFTIKASDSKAIKIAAGGQCADNGVEYTKSIDLNGGIDTTTKSRSISFDVEGSVTVKVVASGGTADTPRTLRLDDKGDNSSEGVSTDDTIRVFTFKYESDTDTSKTLYLYGKNGGIKIYEIKVYSGIIDDEPIVPPTEEPTEATTADEIMNVPDEIEAEVYSEATTINNIGVIATLNNKIAVVEDSASVEEKEYPKAFQLLSTGNKEAGALHINSEKLAKISVIVKGTEGKTLVLEDSSGNKQNLIVSAEAQRLNFENNVQGELWLYPESLAENETINIYSIELFNISDKAKYNLTGFEYESITGGGIIDESNTAYKKVTNAIEFEEAINGAKNKKVKVIQIMNNLNLGINEVNAAYAAENKTKTLDIIKANTFQALNNSILRDSGVSSVTLEGINGLTIFSTGGAKIKHACFTIKYSSNIIIRNIEFDEIWEWDEGYKQIDVDNKVKFSKSEPGDYDRNDWDYITVENNSSTDKKTIGIWIDHCTFNKAYDGLVDMKNGAKGVILSWCKFQGDSQSGSDNLDTDTPTAADLVINEENDSWVTKQIKMLETIYQTEKDDANITKAAQSQNPLYYQLRKNQGYTPKEIIAVEAPHKKAHLIGQTNPEPGTEEDNMKVLSMTIYNCYYNEIQDRIPRLRRGNAHIFNTYIDSSELYNTKKLKDWKPGDSNSYKDAGYPTELKVAGWSFGLSNQALLSTCKGALLGENLYIKNVESPISYQQDEGTDNAGKFSVKNIIYNTNGKYTTIADVIKEAELPFKLKYEDVTTPLEFSWNETSDYIKDQKLTYETMYKDMLIEPNKLEEEVVPYTGAGNSETGSWSIKDWLSVEYK